MYAHPQRDPFSKRFLSLSPFFLQHSIEICALSHKNYSRNNYNKDELKNEQIRQIKPRYMYIYFSKILRKRGRTRNTGEREVRFFLLPPAGRAIGGEGRGSGGKERRNGVKSFLEYRRGDARIRTGIEASRWIA